VSFILTVALFNAFKNGFNSQVMIRRRLYPAPLSL